MFREHRSGVCKAKDKVQLELLPDCSRSDCRRRLFGPGDCATQKNPAVYMMGCPCHILHNTEQKANHSFRNVCQYILMHKII